MNFLFVVNNSNWHSSLINYALLYPLKQIVFELFVPSSKTTRPHLMNIYILEIYTLSNCILKWVCEWGFSVAFFRVLHCIFLKRCWLKRKLALNNNYLNFSSLFKKLFLWFLPRFKAATCPHLMNSRISENSAQTQML